MPKRRASKKKKKEPVVERKKTPSPRLKPTLLPKDQAWLSPTPGEMKNLHPKPGMDKNPLLTYEPAMNTLCPPITKPGYLNYIFQQQRTMAAEYECDLKRASFLIGMKKDFTYADYLGDNYEVCQDQFQPEIGLPTIEVMEEVRQNIVLHGVTFKSFDRYTFRNYMKNSDMDIYARLALAVVDLQPYYNFKFESEDHVIQIREENMKRAKKLNQLWMGLFYWNTDIFPIPTHYMNKKGSVSSKTPLKQDLECPLFKSFRDANLTDPEWTNSILDRINSGKNKPIPKRPIKKKSKKKKKKKKAEEPLQKSQRSLEAFGFKKTKKKKTKNEKPALKTKKSSTMAPLKRKTSSKRKGKPAVPKKKSSKKIPPKPKPTIEAPNHIA